MQENNNMLTFIAESLTNTFKLLKETIEISTSQTFISINNSLTETLEVLKKKMIDIPELTLEEIERREKALKTWAKHGWAMPLAADLNFFNVTFENEKDANKYAMKFFNKEEIKYLLNEILKKTKRKTQYNLATNCFNSKKYHAYALIIFSIIDRVFSENFSDNNGKRAIGINAIKKCEEKLNLKQCEKIFISYLITINLVKVLYIFYNDTNNFKNYRETLNRNNLIHGWQIKSVTKTDCVKLFQVLHNLQYMLYN